MIDVDEVAATVSSCPTVARLTPGPGVEAVSYLPGRRVAGVRVGDDGVEVHVVARYGPTMAAVADEIRAALRPLVSDGAVAVVIHDLDLRDIDLDERHTGVHQTGVDDTGAEDLENLEAERVGGS